MAYGDDTTGIKWSGVVCNCNQTWGIGLPFDHPIWQQITYCPMHSTGGTNTTHTITGNWCWAHTWIGRHLNVRVCKHCGVDETWNSSTATVLPYSVTVSYT